MFGFPPYSFEYSIIILKSQENAPLERWVLRGEEDYLIEELLLELSMIG